VEIDPQPALVGGEEALLGCLVKKASFHMSCGKMLFYFRRGIGGGEKLNSNEKS
jgi:hypothetical protein